MQGNMEPLSAIQVPIKTDLKDLPGLPPLNSPSCVAMIMGYVGRRDVVYNLLQQLSHTTRSYCTQYRSQALQTYVPKNLPFRANPTPEVRFNVGEFGVDYYPRPGPIPSLSQYLLPENKTSDQKKEWVKSLASLDIWLPPREPWKLPNPLPGLKPLTAVNLVFSYVGWFEEVPELLQELSQDSRSYIIHV